MGNGSGELIQNKVKSATDSDADTPNDAIDRAEFGAGTEITVTDIPSPIRTNVPKNVYATLGGTTETLSIAVLIGDTHISKYSLSRIDIIESDSEEFDWVRIVVNARAEKHHETAIIKALFKKEGFLTISVRATIKTGGRIGVSRNFVLTKISDLNLDYLIEFIGRGYLYITNFERDRRQIGWKKSSDSEIVSNIVAKQSEMFERKLSLIIRNSNIQKTKSMTGHFVTQMNETDYELITRLAKKNGFEYFFAENSFHFHKFNPVIKNKTIALNGGSFDEIVFGHRDDSKIVGKINSSLFTESGKLLSTTAGPESGVNSDIKITREAKDLLEQGVFRGEGSFVTANPGAEELPSASTGEFVSPPPSITDKETLDNFALSMQRKRSIKSTIKISGLRGDPEIRPRSVIFLSGGRIYSGDYYVSKVVHHLVSGRYLMNIDVLSIKEPNYAVPPHENVSDIVKSGAPGKNTVE